GATRIFYQGRPNCAPLGADPTLCTEKYLKISSTRRYDGCMAIPRPQPVYLHEHAMHEHAMDNLRYIRQTMERAGSFTAVPGVGGVLVGLTALGASRIAGRQASLAGWITVWTVAAGVALAIGIMGAAL